MPSRNSSIKPNGYAGSHGRVNGHAPASTEGGGIPAPRDQAASVDTRRASAAMDARCTVAPGTDCAGYAEVAPPHPNGPVVHLEARKTTDRVQEEDPLPPADFPLPLHPGEFVEEIHRNADLLIAWQRLLNSKDEKVRQRAVEKLTELRYKGAAALADEPRRIIIDMPEPNRD